MNTLYLAWEDPSSRAWSPVGRLTHENDLFRFVYTKGAQKLKSFTTFGSMKELDRVYKSSEIFPIFSNRLLPKSRPEYKEYIDWLGFSDDNAGPLEQLARSGGIKETDFFMTYQVPEEQNNNFYETCFFVHGMRYLRSEDINLTEELRPGSRLYPMFDVQNIDDPEAVALSTEGPDDLVGYLPRYLVADVRKLMDLNDQKAELIIEKVNLNAPLQMKLLCRFRAKWPKEFAPSRQDDLQPICN